MPGSSVQRPLDTTRPLPVADLDHVLLHTQGLWEALHGARLFVTGGTGFFGRWMIESFLRANEEYALGARVLLLTRDEARLAAGAPHIVDHAAVDVVTGDIRTLASTDIRCTDVLHMAAETTYPPGGVSSAAAFDSAVVGTERVLALAHQCRCRRLLFTSSGAVYGRQPPECRRLDEESRLAPPTWDVESGYAQGKRAAEFLCASAAAERGLQATLARCFAFVGPLLALDANYAIGNFIRDALWHPAISVQGDGAAVRSYLYAADLAVWLWHVFIRGVPGRPYNLGSSFDISIGDLAQAVVDCLCPGKPVQVALSAVAGALPARYVPDTRRAEEELGLKVLVNLEEGIRRTAAWSGWRPAPAQGAQAR